jgi:hypothetical protein
MLPPGHLLFRHTSEGEIYVVVVRSPGKAQPKNGEHRVPHVAYSSSKGTVAPRFILSIRRAFGDTSLAISEYRSVKRSVG